MSFFGDAKNNDKRLTRSNKKMSRKLSNQSDSDVSLSNSSINSSTKSPFSKYSRLPDISASTQNLNNGNNMFGFNNVQQVLKPLTLAFRFPTGKRVVYTLMDQSITLKDLISNVAEANDESFDFAYLECLNGANLGGPLLFTKVQMDQPVKALNIGDRSVIILQYSE